MITNLEKKLKFIELVDEMKNIERAIFLRNWKQETDAEHSYHLAMMVITFADDFPELNIEKCLKLALIHDVVEIYAWDTVALDKEAEKTKDEREKASLLRLEKEFGDILPEFIELLKEYECKASKEAKFVYSLDKVHPIMQVVMEKWKTWKNWWIDFDEIMQRQYSKIYPEFWLEKILDIYFERAKKEKLFYKKDKDEGNN